MKIVIDIDDNLYTRLFDNGVDNYDDAVDMAKAIRKGTPLPKGHGRLIDRDSLELDCDWSDYYDGFSAYSESQVRLAPTIIEADMKESEE